MLNLKIAQGLMQMIKEIGPEEMLIKQGVSGDLFEKVKGAVPWTGEDRSEVTRALDALCHGTCDKAGVQRVREPAEFRAALIKNFVHPVNVMLACDWSQVHESATEMAAGNSSPIPHKKITSEQLFGIVCCLYGDPKHVETPFKNAVRVAIDEYMRTENGKPGVKK